MKASQRTLHDTSEAKVARELGLFAPFECPATWGRLEEEEDAEGASKLQDWRTVKDRTKTNHVLLLLCLNVGIDPPDVMRVEPCAKLECWTDPLLAQSKMLTKGSEVIGDLLIEQYKSLQKCDAYKACLEVSVDDLKYNLQAMRQKAKDGRVLVHYNGHGVPRATQYGELWFFDADHTHYAPFNITDIMAHIGSPTIYVLDCNNAGAILHYWYENNFHIHRRKDILICACRKNEDLPLNPILPADIFTACLTTPIRASLEWYFHYSQRECLLPNVTKTMIHHIPGNAGERKTPLGELNWIFTAVTDAIAWCTLPRDLFNRLFRPRHDMLQVALFRNFLLADRIMREAGCTPLTHPALPETHAHPMWEVWELALEGILSQLPKMLNSDMTPNTSYVYKPSSFFSEQLTAFEIWVEFGGKSSPTPDHLPCIIQGLSSHQYRVRSLRLLARYLDLGDWAVAEALSCGVMPYVCRLLHQTDLINFMVVIWTKILAVDNSEATLHNLVRTQMPPAKKFLTVLNPASELAQGEGSQPNEEAERYPLMDGTTAEQCCAMACFIIGVITEGCGTEAQVLWWNWGLLPSCLRCFKSPNHLLQVWSALCMAKLVSGNVKAMEYCIVPREVHLYDLPPLLGSPSQEVRAACVYTLSQLVGLGALHTQLNFLYADVAILQLLSQVVDDPSPLVREEVLHALASYFVAYGFTPKSPALQGQSGLLEQPDTKSCLHLENPTTNYSSHSGAKNAPLPVLSVPGADGGRASRGFTHGIGGHHGYGDLDSSTGPPPVDEGSGKSEVTDCTSSPSNIQNLRIRLVADVREVLRSLEGDSFPPLEMKVRRVMEALNTQKEKENLPVSMLFLWMKKQIEKPLFRVEESVSSLERRKFREQLNRDTLQTYVARASERRYLATPSGAADRIPKEQVSLTPLLHNTDSVIASAFRAFTPHAVLADSKNISVVDTSSKTVLTTAVHPHPLAHTFILNDATDFPQLLVTDMNGSVTVYSNFVPSQAASSKMHGMTIDTAFSASSSPSSVCADWQPSDSTLIYSGDPLKVSFYAMEEERLQQAISLPPRGVGLTVLKADDSGSRAIAGGFEDGSIKYWDARAAGDAHHLFAWLAAQGPQDPVVDLCLRHGSHLIYSAHKSGAIKVWDLRSTRYCRKIDAYQSKSLTFAQLHHSHPLLLCGYSGGNQPGKLEFISTKNECLGEVPLPKMAHAHVSAHLYQPAILMGKYLLQF